MLAHSLQSKSEIWAAFCKARVGGECGRRNCSGVPSKTDGFLRTENHQLPWLFGSCSVHALACVVFLLFLFLWSIVFLRKGFRNLRRPAAATKQELNSNGVQQGKGAARVVATRARKSFAASIWVCAFLFVENLALSLFHLGGVGSIAPVHVEATTWIQAAGWLALTIAANSTRAKKEGRIPLLMRAWWVAAFVLALLSLVPSFWKDEESHQFTTEEWLETASVFVTAFLFVVAVFGQTGVAMIEDGGLKEPLLGEEAAADEAATEGPGVTHYATAGLFSQITFSWLNPVFAAGYKSPLELKDVPLLAPGDRSESNYAKFKYNWEKQAEKDPAKSPSLLLAIGQSFWRLATFNAVLAAANSVAGYVGPFLLEDFVDYLAGRRRFAYEGYLLVLILFLAKIIETVSGRVWYQGMQLLGLHLRSSLTGFVYRKGLRLSSQARQGQTTGEIINYVSVDVQRIGDFSWYFHDLWCLPLQVLLALLILYKVLGVAAVSALVASIVVMIINVPLAKMQDSYQDKLMAAKDKRMKALTECLRSMRILKLQAWETQYLSKIEALRKVECRHLRGSLYTGSAMTFVFWSAPMFVSVATFGTCVLLGTPLTAGRILSALATFRVLQEPLIQVPDLISMMAQTKVSLDRLEKYLVEEELQGDAVIRTFPTPGDETELAIDIDGADFIWDPSAEGPTLQSINLQVKKGQRVAICGTVGSGKSSLLSCILGEVPRVSGTVKVCGTTAYVSQTAWIQSIKIEENILFGSAMNRTRYKETVRVCALEKDMDLFDSGDQTLVGERGINMSGGQKQRIQLARALYQDSDIYLLDDPFSAVDAHTGSELFQGCIMGALSRKTVLYVTHQVEFLPAADLILVMRDGKIVQSGKYDDLLQAGMDFKTLVNAHNEAIELMVSSGYKKQDKEEHGPRKTQDETDVDEPAQISRQLSGKNSGVEIVPQDKRWQLVGDEEREIGNTSVAIYWAYITAVYSGALIPFILLAQLSFQALQIAGNYWMAWSTPATSGEPQRVDNTTLILVYCMFALGSSTFVSIRAVLVSTVGLLGAQKFFTNLLRAIFRAPMSFFDSTPTGRILARVSSDQNTVDLEILFTFSNLMVNGTQVLGIIVVICQITWHICLLFVPVVVACVFMQRYYIKSARELQRLSGILRSPIIHHYAETIAGVVTIRGFSQDQRFSKANLEIYDNFGRAHFHNFSAIQWLMFRMEMLSTLVFIFALLYAVRYIGGMDPGLAGLAVAYGLQLNVVQSYMIWSLCYMENRIIAVERILQYTGVKSEAPAVVEKSRPPKEWPSEGTIELHDLQVRYNPESPMILHGVTCTFPAGEKIGVVGRTASGKSTLIQTLFRMVEPCGGSIVIDGIDISSIGLHDLRKKLSIIPQEPTLFEATMRINLDPLEQHSDAEIWEALDKCQLGDIVRAKGEKLDCLVNEGGENWSVGQRQLVCLGRALLKRTTILILDEATASVDSATDGIIQRTIRNEFQNCTVITVAHRIPTVIDSDRAMVLSYGKIAEYNTPKKLLEDKNSLFYKLVSEYSSR